MPLGHSGEVRSFLFSSACSAGMQNVLRVFLHALARGVSVAGKKPAMRRLDVNAGFTATHDGHTANLHTSKFVYLPRASRKLALAPSKPAEFSLVGFVLALHFFAFGCFFRAMHRSNRIHPAIDVMVEALARKSVLAPRFFQCLFQKYRHLVVALDWGISPHLCSNRSCSWV
jgi:hypothetical protein